MLIFKEKVEKEKYKELLDESYITESAFYIGTQKWINDIIQEKLINRVSGKMDDGMVLFNLFINFLVIRFKNTDCTDLYKYIDEYAEEDLQDFIRINFVDETEK